IAHELVDVTTVAADDRHEDLEQAVQRRDYLGRRRALGKGREVGHVAEHDRYLHLDTVRGQAPREDEAGDVLVAVDAERLADALAVRRSPAHAAEPLRQPAWPDPR